MNSNFIRFISVAGIEDKGKRIKLRITDATDLNRDVLKVTHTEFTDSNDYGYDFRGTCFYDFRGTTILKNGLKNVIFIKLIFASHDEISLIEYAKFSVQIS